MNTKKLWEEAGEMAQCVKCLLYKNEDLDLDPQHTCKRLGVVNTRIPALGCWKQEGL